MADKQTRNEPERAYDLVIIGAGPAGSMAVDEALASKKRVALVERDKLGGTCLNYGCDPTKTLLHIAHLRHWTGRADEYGLRLPLAEVDWAGVQARVGRVIEQMRGGPSPQAEEALRKRGLDLFKGQASFRSPHEIEVNGQVLRAEQILIAVGSLPSVPPIKGLKESGYITNIEAVSLPAVPGRLAVLGGGVIGIEFAQMFSRFGAEVTVLEHSDQMLATEDRELADQLCGLLLEEGIRLVHGIEMQEVRREKEGKRLTYKCEGGLEELLVDEILVAVGREPALEGLNLEAAGVESFEKGIRVDPTLRTNVPHIWAVGDIASPYQFTHIASDQGALAVRNAFAARPQAFVDKAIPWVTYTQPELSHVGQTEEELREARTDYKALRLSFAGVERAVTDGETVGTLKLLVSPQDGRILGGHILGPQAGELIAPVVLAMRHDLTVGQLAETILPYPTLAAAVRQVAQQQ